MNYLLLALIALGGLIVVLTILFALSRRSQSVGGATGYVAAVLANILVNIETRMELAAFSCHNGCIASLPGMNTSGHWHMKTALRLCMYFALGSCILLGEVVGIMQVLHAMSPTLPDIASSRLAEFAQAALWLCCPALFGDILLTCCNIQSSLIFKNNMGKLARWILGIVSFILLVFSIAVNSYFYMYRGVLLSPSPADRHQAAQMIPYILTGLGLEVSAISPFAFLAMFEGSDGVIPLLLWGASMVCKIIAALVSFPSHMFNVISTRLGGESVYTEPDIVIGNATIVRINRIAINSVQTQQFSSAPHPTGNGIGSTGVTFVDGKLTALPNPILNEDVANGSSAGTPPIPPPDHVGKEREPLPKPEKPKKQGGSRRLSVEFSNVFIPYEDVQPGQDQANGNNHNGRDISQNGNNHSEPVEKEPVNKPASPRKGKGAANSAKAPAPGKLATRRRRTTTTK